jgi:uncharacterized protein involved in response to NO
LRSERKIQGAGSFGNKREAIANFGTVGRRWKDQVAFMRIYPAATVQQRGPRFVAAPDSWDPKKRVLPSPVHGPSSCETPKPARADQKTARISGRELCEEPFRLFFPGAVLAGLIGVLLWPLYFGGVHPNYPAISHARLMAHGFFGGFIFGFLGTALPRVLSVKRLTVGETALFFLLYGGMIVAHALGKTFTGDALFLGLLIGFVSALVGRLPRRKDIPPPGFVLVGLAFVCAAAGAVISLLESRLEGAFFWLFLKPLLYYQGFVLLPILGIGGFLLPRFFGLNSAHDFPESVRPPPGWMTKAIVALAVGLLILGSFVIEAAGNLRLGHAIRFITVAAYLFHEVPVFRMKTRGQSLALGLKTGFGLLLFGILAIAVSPAYRVALLHFTLIGGFGIIALTVATRVIFGHSGNQARLAGRHRWFTLAAGLMVLGMATRITGDFWPRILATHYVYGALLWAAALVLWAVCVLPKVLVSDPEK